MKRTSLLLALIMFSAAAFNSAFAQQTADIPQVISYQGVITAADGKALPDGQYQLVVTLYGDETGTAPVWIDAYTTALNNGIFDLYLGSRNPLPSATAMNRPLWVGVKVNGAEEMRPLTRLTSSPYAMNVPDKSITTSKLATGAVTADKVSMNYVAGITVNGEKLEGNGTVLNITSGRDVQLNYDKNNNTLAIEMTGSSSSRGDDDKNSSELLVGEYNPSPVANFNFVAVPANYSTISGGQTNSILLNTDHGTIGGGNANTLEENADRSTIGGGNTNTIRSGATGNTIAGGEFNVIDTNTVTSTIGGGSTNYINQNLSCVTIAGGCNNTVNAPNSTIGGGVSNRIDGPDATIAGGNSNTITPGAPTSAIGGGAGNVVDAPDGTISGGTSNNITPGAVTSAIGGGNSNRIDAGQGTIGGGISNTIGTAAPTSAIGGGSNNRIDAQTGTIGGGASNNITPVGGEGTIGGGVANRVDMRNGTISGGSRNTITGANFDHGTIGGGISNTITPTGSQATIPGGNNLIAQSWAQTVIGTYNRAVGAVTVNYGGAVAPSWANFDEPLFIVGRGYVDPFGVPVRSNAFEVSYNGHSVVYHNQNNVAANPVVIGGTYIDNIVYAWGNVQALGAINCSFGVATVTRLAVGHYRIRINPVDPVTNLPVNILCGSITATVNTGGGPIPVGGATAICHSIRATQIVGNAFDILITQMGAACNLVDAPFNFKLTGRP